MGDTCVYKPDHVTGAGAANTSCIEVKAKVPYSGEGAGPPVRKNVRLKKHDNVRDVFFFNESRMLTAMNTLWTSISPYAPAASPSPKTREGHNHAVQTKTKKT